MIQRILLTALLMAAIDIPYLTLVASNSFKPMIQAIQGSPLVFRLIAAVPVYLALAYLLNLANSWKQAAAIGAATYAVYDFTNYASLKNYTLSFALQETAWGSILFALTWLALNKLGL
jgi:uncharacterized membrane protein